MPNCLAPGFVRFHYTSNGHQHTMTIPVEPLSVTSNFNVRCKDGSNVSQSDALDALIAVVAPFFHTTDTFDGADWFTQADCASVPVWQNAFPLVGDVGTC